MAKHDLEVCDSRYVKWAWLSGILITFLIVIATTAYAGGKAIQKHTNRIDNLEKLHVRKEITLIRIEEKLDTLLKR